MRSRQLCVIFAFFVVKDPFSQEFMSRTAVPILLEPPERELLERARKHGKNKANAKTGMIWQFLNDRCNAISETV